jgi:outer membrane protein
MKKAALGVVFLAGSLFVASAALGAEQFKFAYVDMQRALNYCEAGKEAKKQMTLEVEKIQKLFAAKQKEVEKLKEDLEKRSSVMSEAVRKEKERDYQTKLRDIQRMQRDTEDEIRAKDRELTEKILKKLADIIRKLGEERRYTMVLEKNQPAVIYVSAGLDITEEVIKLMDQQR